MQSIGQVFGNSLEDSIDDFVSDVIFTESRELTKETTKSGGDLSKIDEFKNNFITQLLMGLAMIGYQFVMKTIEVIAEQMAMGWAYIVSGKLKEKINKLKAKNIKGKKALNLLGAVIGTDKTAERIEVVKIAQNNMSEVRKEMQYIKENRFSIEDKLTKQGMTQAQLKGVSSQEDFNLYLHKTKTSSWNKTAKDKKLFEKITGEKIADSGINWGDLVDTLNQYSEFAKDSENKIYNLTEAILKIVNKTNLAK